MKRPIARLMLLGAAAAACIAGLTVTPASASAQHPANHAAAATLPTTCCRYIVGSNAFGHNWWWELNTAQLAIEYTLAPPAFSVQPTGSGPWQLLEVWDNTSNTLNGCLAFDAAGGGDLKVDGCTGVDSERWASSYNTIDRAGDVLGVLLWNKYFNEVYLGWCPTGNSAVVTDNGTGGLAYLACPQLPGGGFSNKQYWTFSTNGI